MHDRSRTWNLDWAAKWTVGNPLASTGAASAQACKSCPGSCSARLLFSSAHRLVNITGVSEDYYYYQLLFVSWTPGSVLPSTVTQQHWINCFCSGAYSGCGEEGAVALYYRSVIIDSYSLCSLMFWLQLFIDHLMLSRNMLYSKNQIHRMKASPTFPLQGQCPTQYRKWWQV